MRYGKRPSEIVGLSLDSPVALDFDTAIMFRGLLEEERKQKEWDEKHKTNADDVSENLEGADAENLIGEIRF